MENTTKPEGVSLKVKFNKKEYTLDEPAAKNYAEMGMKYEQLLPSLKKASFLAACKQQNLPSFIDEISSKRDADLRQSFREKVGDDEELIEKLIEIENQKAGKSYEKLKRAEEGQSDKVDDNGFELIKTEFPEYKSAEDLPDTVKKTAEENGIGLFDALLRYLFAQHKKQEYEKNNQQKAKQSSTGSQKNSDTKNTSAPMGAMLKGIWG